MIVSNEFNRLYHGCYLADFHDQLLAKCATFGSLDKFKQTMKDANKLYPVYKKSGKKVSTRDILNKDLVYHIEWIRRHFANYGVIANIDEEQYKRMMELAHN